jgi:hypothetical protein
VGGGLGAGSTAHISLDVCQRLGEHPGVMRADVMSQQVGHLLGMRHDHEMGRTVMEGISRLHGASEPPPPPPRNAGFLSA